MKKLFKFLLAVIIFILFLISLSFSYYEYEYNRVLLFDASKQKSKVVKITLPDKWRYNDNWFHFFLRCDRSFHDAVQKEDRYMYPPDFMQLIRNKLKDNIVISSNDGEVQSAYFPYGGETGFSADEIAHVVLDPYPESKITYTFSLKNSSVFRGIACDIYIGQPNI